MNRDVDVVVWVVTAVQVSHLAAWRVAGKLAVSQEVIRRGPQPRRCPPDGLACVRTPQPPRPLIFHQLKEESSLVPFRAGPPLLNAQRCCCSSSSSSSPTNVWTCVIPAPLFRKNTFRRFFSTLFTGPSHNCSLDVDF